MTPLPPTATKTLCHDVSKKTTNVYTYCERVYDMSMRWTHVQYVSTEWWKMDIYDQHFHSVDMRCLIDNGNTDQLDTAFDANLKEVRCSG